MMAQYVSFGVDEGVKGRHLVLQKLMACCMVALVSSSKEGI